MSGSLDWISHGIGKLSDSPLTNPNKIFGLDLWGREQPGGLVDRLENSVQDRTGLPTGTIGRYNQHYGPQTAGLILGSIFGGGALAGGGSAGSGSGYTVLDGMPALGDGAEGGAFDMYGSLSSPTDGSTIFDGARPGLWQQQNPFNSNQGNMSLGGQQGGMLQHKGAPPILMQMPEMVPVYPGILNPFLRS